MPVYDPSLRLAGQLDEQRDERDIADVPLRWVAPVVAAAEAVALVDGDDHERLVPQPGLVQPRDEAAEQLVREAGLEQVPLPGLLSERFVPPRLFRAAGRARHGDSADVAVGVVEPRPVREENVQVVERRRRSGRLELRDPAVEIVQPADVEGLQVHLRQLRLALQLAPGVGAEVGPRLVDGGQALLEHRRRD